MKSLKVIFLLSLFHLIISMVRINVVECWYIFCVRSISPVSTMLFVFVELVCILKYKLHKSYLCLTHGQLFSSLVQSLSTRERITSVVECMHHDMRKI